MTGSSGWLGQHLAPRLRRDNHHVVGLDVVDGATTDVVGSVADRPLLARVMDDHRIDAIAHCGALHKPDIVRYPRQSFIDVNITGTMNLLEEAVARDIKRVVVTSTTSLMISKEIRAWRATGAKEAIWLDESTGPLKPRNIYGVSKLAAEHLCRLFHELHGLPVLLLRTSRFFPEDDDMAHTIEQNAENTKTNELLYRRLTVADAAEAHVVALDRAPELGFDTFIVSAMPPFSRDDAAELMTNAPAVVERSFPHYRAIYDRLGWTMFDSIDRIYDPSHAAKRLGFVCRTDFAARLAELASRLNLPVDNS